jgi:hypothetical protein
MNGLRSIVLDRLAADSEMNGFGYDSASLYAQFSRDATPEYIEGRRFGILKWGTTERGVGRVNSTTLEIWLYDKDPDYSAIGSALLRARILLDALPGVQLDAAENAWCLDARWEGASPDGYDDMYKAVLRSESYTITASGN